MKHARRFPQVSFPKFGDMHRNLCFYAHSKLRKTIIKNLIQFFPILAHFKHDTLTPYSTLHVVSLISSNAERNKASSQPRAFFHNHMGLSNNSISRKLLIWFMEQNMLLFAHIIDIRDEPARPSLDVLWRVISQSVLNIQTLKFYATWLPVLNMVSQCLKCFEVKAFFVMPNIFQFRIHFCV